jgi:hypothetical protein
MADEPLTVRPQDAQYSVLVPCPPEVRPQDAQYSILVPCPPEKFADFMSKLLGKPQVVEGRFRGPFNIELTDIENFYHLIQYRITEQNKGQLIQFTSNINYDDGTSVEVEGLANLKTYSEVRPLVSTGVVLTWVYLVNFNNAPVPEKQQIEVNIDTSRRPRKPVRPVYPFPFPEMLEDIISYRVSYTARSWGADIENLLKDHIRSLIIPEDSNLRAFIRRWRTYVMNFVALALYAIFLRVGVWGADWISRATSAKYSQIENSGLSQTEQIIRKLDYVYSTIAGTMFVSAMSVILLYLGVTLIISFATATMISENIAPARPSFVLLTRNAEYAKSAALQEYEKNWTIYFGTFAFACLAGVVGNILTWFIWG